jgi:hypothetical protein
MNKKAFHFEIHDLLTQFVAAYDDVVISRYNKNRVEKERIKVRYVHAPKNRIIYDLNNKAQNLTLPVISVSITSIERDESRVFNKIAGMYLPIQATDNSPVRTAQIRMPVPVNISLAVSIIAQYQTDVEQIISNFIPYTNPYIIISWKIPEEFHLGYTNEIRTEVFWSGSMALEYPIEVTSSDKARFSANTAFTIKGLLFPEAPDDPYKNIYFIDNNLKSTSNILLNLEDYQYMEDNSYVYDAKNKILNETSTAHVSGSPYLTNIYRNVSSVMKELSGSVVLEQISGENIHLTVLGKRFNSQSYVLLSSVNTINTLNLTSFEFTYFPTISGYVIPCNILSENVLTFELPNLNINTPLNLIVGNSIGWSDVYSINTQINYVTI